MKRMIKRLLEKQKVRFLLVGSINTLIDIGIYLTLTTLGMPFFIANLISTTVGLICSFILNQSFTFIGSTRKLHHQIGIFTIVTLIGLWGIQPIVIGVSSHGVHGLPKVLEIILPKLLATCVSFVWNYVWYREVVFSTKAQQIGKTNRL